MSSLFEWFSCSKTQDQTIIGNNDLNYLCLCLSFSLSLSVSVSLCLSLSLSVYLPLCISLSICPLSLSESIVMVSLLFIVCLYFLQRQRKCIRGEYIFGCSLICFNNNRCPPWTIHRTGPTLGTAMVPLSVFLIVLQSEIIQINFLMFNNT